MVSLILSAMNSSSSSVSSSASDDLALLDASSPESSSSPEPRLFLAPPRKLRFLFLTDLNLMDGAGDAAAASGSGFTSDMPRLSI